MLNSWNGIGNGWLGSTTVGCRVVVLLWLSVVVRVFDFFEPLPVKDGVEDAPSCLSVCMVGGPSKSLRSKATKASVVLPSVTTPEHAQSALSLCRSPPLSFLLGVGREEEKREAADWSSPRSQSPPLPGV